MTTRDQLLAMLPIHDPDAIEIAKTLGVTRGRLYQLLDDMGVVIRRTWEVPPLDKV